MVNTIFQFGQDALDNEATIHIDTSSLGLGLSNLVDGSALDFRATNFSIPSFEVATYEQTYKGFTIERWKQGTDMTRTTDITFRVDKYWKVYDFLLSWQRFISDIGGDGSYFPDEFTDNSLLRTTMTIHQISNSLNSDGSANEGGTILAPGWVYTGVWPKSIPQIDFDNTSAGEVRTLDVTFGFLTVTRGSDA